MKTDPSLEELGKDESPPSPGLVETVRFFAAGLDDRWECYLRPHLNGLRPDAVLLHDFVGVTVVAMRDWSAVDLERYLTRDVDRDGRFVPHPFNELSLYVEELQVRFSHRNGGKPGMLGAVQGLLVLPEVTAAEADELLAHATRKSAGSFTVLAGDDLASGEVARGLTALRSPDAITGMTPQIAAGLRPYLAEPDISAEKRQVLPLTEAQRRLAKSRTSTGYRRVTGPAGSGKSTVVAARAAELAISGKRVLVVGYNITLWHYLRGLAERHATALGGPAGRRALRSSTFLHFHEYCKRLCTQADLRDEYRALWVGRDEDAAPPDEELVELTLRALDVLGPSYDAVLVDEGQDFTPGYWQVLDRSVRDGGERLFVLDLSQDLYERAEELNEGWMTRSGFGNWSKLDRSYRLPYQVADMLTDYGSRFLDADFDSPKPDDPTLVPPTLRWVPNVSELVEVGAQEIALAWERIDAPDVLAMADVFYLCPNRDLGRAVSNELRRVHGIRTRDAFGTNSQNVKAAKQEFWADDARVKGSTPHSVKGWEARAVVVLADRLSSQWAWSALYVSMSRVKAYPAGSLLTVLCATNELLDFARDHFTIVDR